MIYISSWVGTVMVFLVFLIIILVVWLLTHTVNEDDCDLGRPCPSGLICQQGRCVLSGTCRNSADCLGNNMCINGICQECGNSQQCPVGSVCSGGRCSIVPCSTTNPVCPSGLTCNISTSSCQPLTCQSSTDCQSNEICHNGFCVPVGNTCTSSRDCQGGTFKCLNNVCQQCINDTDCPGGQICQKQNQGSNLLNIGICQSPSEHSDSCETNTLS